MEWNSSSHPISDIRNWSRHKLLEIRPDFQRRQVWSDAAKIMLMDTVLNDIPMPKIYFQSVVKEDDSYRIVIDGQQRLTAILDFLRGAFSLASPYVGQHKGKKFSELPVTIQKRFLNYKIDINEIIDVSDEEIREIYSRVNKYTFALNRQELRRADYPGDFLRAAEDLSILPFFESSRVFTVAHRRRMHDVEYVSEILAGLLEGAQDKMKSLDDFYQTHSKWEAANRSETEAEFSDIISDIEKLFSESLPIYETRFRQKADLYCLFLAIAEMKRKGHSIANKDLTMLRKDFALLNENIRPESGASILSEYAIKCVSQANSVSSRKWRQNLLVTFLFGTYAEKRPTKESLLVFHKILSDFYEADDGGMCPPTEQSCGICDIPITDFSSENVIFDWPTGTKYYQFSNGLFFHTQCSKAGRKQ